MSNGAGSPLASGLFKPNKEERIMKLMKYVVAALAFVAAVGCTHEPDVAVVESKTPQIAAHNDVVVNNLTENETFTLTWSSARLGEGTIYTVSADAGAGMVELGTTSECYYNTTNIALLEMFSITKMGEYAIDFKVVATSDAGVKLESEAVSVLFDYNKIAYLYILGDYQGWGNTNPCSRLLQGEDGIFRGFFHDTTGGGFKICTQYGWDGTNYGWADEAISTDGGAGNITLAKGLYYVEFDEENLSLLTIPVTAVGLIGEAVGGWDKDYAYFEYDAESNSWLGAANVVEDKEYKIRFNEAWSVMVDEVEYDFSLGGDAADLALKGGNLKSEGSGIYNFRLSIFDYPYTISTEAMSEKEDVLYVVKNDDYKNAAAMSSIYNEDTFTNTYCGMLDMEADGDYLYARLRSNLGTRFGGAVDALTAYAGGTEAEGIAVAQGLHYVYADLNEGKMTSTTIAINSIGLVGGLNDWNAEAPIELTYDAASKSYKVTTNIPSDGEFKLVMNKMWSTQVNGVEHQMSLGGSCTNMVVNGGNLFITAGEHSFELTFGKIITLAIDGKVADISPAPELLEITGSFAHYVWSNSPYLTNVDGGNPNLYEGILDMYKPAESTAENAEFKITYKGQSAWFSTPTTSTVSPYVFNIEGNGDNMTIPFGLYYWNVDWNPIDGKGVATATEMVSVNLIGMVEGTEWSQDFALESNGAGLYSGEYTISGEFKVRFHEADFTDDTAWKYSIGNAGTADVTVGETTACRWNGGNFKVAEGTYLVEVNLAVTPATITLTAK